MHYTIKLTTPRIIHKVTWRWNIEINETWRNSVANWPCQIKCQGAQNLSAVVCFTLDDYLSLRYFKNNPSILRIWIGRKNVPLILRCEQIRPKNKGHWCKTNSDSNQNDTCPMLLFSTIGANICFNVHEHLWHFLSMCSTIWIFKYLVMLSFKESFGGHWIKHHRHPVFVFI